MILRKQDITTQLHTKHKYISVFCLKGYLFMINVATKTRWTTKEFEKEVLRITVKRYGLRNTIYTNIYT